MWEVSKENYQPLKQGRRLEPAAEDNEPEWAALEAERK